MFMPYDKLFNNVELPKAIIQSQGLNVYEALFSDNHHPFSVIEFLVNNQDIYLKMSSSVQKYNKLENPHLLKIYYWSYEFLLTGNEKIYKFYFVTDHFEKDVKSWLNERSAIKLYLFERDLYKIARDLASLMQYIFSISLPINPIKRETLVVSNNKIKLIPHVFFLEIAEEMSRLKMLSQKVKVEESSNVVFFENSLAKLKNLSNSTQEIMKILDETNALKKENQEGKSPKKSGFKHSPNRSSITSPIVKQMNPTFSAGSPKKSIISPIKIRGFESPKEKEEEKLVKMKECLIEPKERIYSFGILIAMIATLHDSNDERPELIMTSERMKETEKKYGKEFVNLIKKTVSKDKNVNLSEIVEEISYLIKIKGTDDSNSSADKKKKNMSSVIKLSIPLDRQVRFLHCFPELYQKVLFVNIQDKMQSFFEAQDLNVDFIIPVDHRTIAIQKNHVASIFLLGGKNTNSVYRYSADKKLLETKENMIGSLERRSFGICHIKNIIYVAGGYLDNEITKSCESYDIDTNYWCKIKPLNDACTDLSLSSYNDKYIFKFGGQLMTLTLSETIEKYDPLKDRWYTIKYNLEPGLKDSFTFLRNSLSLQISDDEIMIIGGINIYYEGSNKCYLLKIREIEENITKETQNNLMNLMKEKHRDVDYSYEICGLNMLNLPSKDPLELCPPVIIDDEVYLLQFKKNNHRKLISLSREWKEVKDIKW